MMYGVSATTSSRVPATRPARPIAGFSFSRSTARRIFCTTRLAAAGLSCAMYSASVSRLASATFSHLTRTPSPLLRHSLYFALARKFPALRLRQPLVNLFDLPALQRHILPDRFRRQKRPRPPRRRRKFVQLASQPALQPQRKDFLARHGRLPATSTYIVFIFMSHGNPAVLLPARPPGCVGSRLSAVSPRGQHVAPRSSRHFSVYSVPPRLCVLCVNSFFSSAYAGFSIRKYYANHSNLVPHRNSI